MTRYKKLVATTVTAFVLFGCTAEKPPLRRYAIVNNTESTITGLKLSFNGYAKNESKTSWDETLAGQGWTCSANHHGNMTISWHDVTGDHEKMVVVPKNTLFQAKNDFFIELNYGSATMRAIEPTPEERNWSAIVSVYVLYCLFIGLVFGVPLAVIAVIAYMLFMFVRSLLVATAEGLQGDNSVFQFTIRETAMFTVMVALACGWFVNFLAMKH